MVEYLLSRGCDVNAQSNSGRTALWKAAQVGHQEVVQFLFAMGANINIKNQVGATVLFEIAKQDHLLDITQDLIHFGADIQARDIEGNTALHGVSSLGRVHGILTLLEAGINVNRQNDYGNTPLHNASMHNQIPAMICLLNWGASSEIANSSGQRPLYGAMLHLRQEAIRVLHDVGGRLSANEVSMFENFEVRRSEKKRCFYKLALELFRQVKPLTTLCRAIIRRHLRQPAVHFVEQLPLPSTIVTFLMLQDQLH